MRADDKRGIGAAIGLGVGTFVLLSVFKRWATIHLDTARDLLIARDCQWGSQCWGAGSPSSYAGIVQGAFWVHLLQLRTALGLSIESLERIVDAGLAAGAGLVAWIGSSLFARRSSLWVWALWFPLTLSAIDYPTLWNLALLPLATTLFLALLFLGIHTRRAHWFVLAGFACGLVIDIHWVNIIEIPFLLFAIIACAPVPWLTAPASILAMFALLAIDSPTALDQNSRTFSSYAVVALSGAAIVAAMKARQHLASRSAVVRARLLALGQLAYVVVLMVAAAAVTRQPLGFRYFTLAIAPAAWLLGRSSPVPVGRSGAVAALAVTVWYVLACTTDRAWNQKLRQHEVEPIAAALYGRGLSFSDIRRHLRGPNAFEVIAAVAPFEPRLSDLAPTREGRDILLFRSSQRALPRPLPQGWTTVNLGGENVAVIAAYEPFVLTDNVEFCRDPADCIRISFADDPADRGHTGWRARSYPVSRTLQQKFPTKQLAGSRITFRLQIRPPTDAPPREIFALHSAGEVAWRIDGATGDASFPTTEVRLSAQTNGEIVFSGIVSKDRPDEFRAWLPAFVEVPVGPAADTFRNAHTSE